MRSIKERWSPEETLNKMVKLGNNNTIIISGKNIIFFIFTFFTFFEVI